MKKYKEIKKEALRRLEELTEISDDCFVNADFENPLRNQEIGANFSDMCEEADYAFDEGLLTEAEVGKLNTWFLSVCRDYLIDRYSKIDWEAREKARKRLQRTLGNALGIKEVKK